MAAKPSATRPPDAGDPDLMRFEMDDVRATIDEHGDLFEPVLSRRYECVARCYGCDGGSFSGMGRG
jgi:hypothetical protein